MAIPVGDDQKKEIFLEVKSLVNKGMEIAKKVLEEHKEHLDRVIFQLMQISTSNFISLGGQSSYRKRCLEL